MSSARKVAKSVLYHARAARIQILAAPRRVPWLRRRLRLPANRVFNPFHDSAPRGVALTWLDDASSFHRPLPHLPGAPAEALEFFQQHAVETFRPSYVAELTDALAWGHPTGGVFTADGQFVPALTHDPCGEKFHTVWTRWHLPEPRRLPGRVLYLVTPEATDNFHHWLIDLLPRLGLVQRAGYALADFDHVIVNHAARRYQLATLAHLGIDARKIIAADESLFVRADQLVVPSLKAVNQSFPAADLAFLRSAFLGSRVSSQPSRRLYISRGDAAVRRLANEADLLPLLKARGFDIVIPSKLTLPEQARLFAHADIIAGPAGAGFANLVFATAPVRVIEIAPPGWLAVYHWMISARAGLPHTILLGEGPVMRGVPDVSARERDIVLDPDKLASQLAHVTAPSPV